ncbi:MAG: CAP domain-containing protein [Flavobacteriaceae bacterium]
MTSILHFLHVFSIVLLLACSKDSTTESSNQNSAFEDQITKAVFEKTNGVRKEKGLSALSRHEELDLLSKLHSDNMVEHNFFAHEDHQGASPSDRADALNFGWTTIAENIGQVPWFENVTGCGDTRSADAIATCVVEGWRNSPGHYANMIGDFQQIGVGVTFDKDSIVFFTQVFRNP